MTMFNATRRGFAHKAATVLMAAALAGSLVACGSVQATDTASTTTEKVSIAPDTLAEDTATAAVPENSAASSSASSQATGITTVAAYGSGLFDGSEFFTDRDLTQTADLSEATSYTVADGTDITITEAGVYVISGSAKDCTIVVNADDSAKVQLVLDGVSISNADFPAIYVLSADKVFVTTAEGSSNTLEVTGSFISDGDTNTDAVIFAKDDLVLNGLGTLTIKSTDNGVTSKDDLKITGGTYVITASGHCLEANDSIVVADGSFTLKAGKDGLNAGNDDDPSKGYVYIAGGTFAIDSGSDGIHSDSVVQIDGGTYTISSGEGIEGTYVQINGGSIDISASDDGINAANKSSAYEVLVEINGGDISIAMGQGDTDGIDSNGSIVINGGTVDITAQSPFDYDYSGVINGGTVIVNGQQVSELANQFMGGMGGPGMMGGDMGAGPGGMGGGPGGGSGGPGGGPGGMGPR